MHTLTDPPVGPYSPKEEIEAEIKRLDALDPSKEDEGIQNTINELKEWLEDRGN